MSLTAALKKGLSVADTSAEAGADWDPFAEKGAGSSSQGGARPKAAVVKSSAGKTALGRSPIGKSMAGKTGGGTGALEEDFEAALKPMAKTRSRPVAHPGGGQIASSAERNTASNTVPLRRAANQPGRSEGVAATEEKRAGWLDAPSVPVGRVNPAQYARELDRFAADEARRTVADTLLDVRSAEIEGVAKLAARIKARYLAKLLDVGNPQKSGVQETEIKELVRYRETYEELGRGLDMLKASIESGDVVVSGMIRR
jgi:hypothetical protein